MLPIDSSKIHTFVFFIAARRGNRIVWMGAAKIEVTERDVKNEIAAFRSIAGWYLSSDAMPPTPP